jgi:FAD/FMN-containing dehydrogenase
MSTDTERGAGVSPGVCTAPRGEIVRALEDIVGPDFVAADPSTLYIYSRDLTENEPGTPLAVVMPEDTGQVQGIMRCADRFRVPLVPFAYGLNMGGLTIPQVEAVVVDLKRMRRIVEVNEEDLYMVVEPGVTFGMIRAHLDRHHPGYRYTYPLAPPQTSALSNALMDGLNNMSMKHGAMSEWVSGLEVVLPTGEIVRLGSAAVVDSWHARAPLPDLCGLFLGWQGTTGIVTKAALHIWPCPPLRKRMFIPVYDTRSAYRIMRDLCRKEILDDLAGVSWPTGKMLFGARAALELCQGEPTVFVYGDLYAENQRHMAVKEDLLEEVLLLCRKEGMEVEDPLDVDTLLEINPDYGKLADFPTTLDFLLDYGPGGMTWIGSYGPGRNWAEGAERCFSLLGERGFPPILVSRPMKGGHFWVLRFILHFDKRDASDVARAREALSAMADVLLELGYVPYKAPLWAARKIRARDRHGFFPLLERIKQCLDPHGIMNPGRWGLR